MSLDIVMDIFVWCCAILVCFSPVIAFLTIAEVPRRIREYFISLRVGEVISVDDSNGLDWSHSLLRHHIRVSGHRHAHLRVIAINDNMYRHHAVAAPTDYTACVEWNLSRMNYSRIR